MEGLTLYIVSCCCLYSSFEVYLFQFDSQFVRALFLYCRCLWRLLPLQGASYLAMTSVCTPACDPSTVL